MFEILYYSIYRVVKKIPSNDTPKYSSILLLTLLMMINLINVFRLYQYYFDFIWDKNVALMYGMSIFFLILIFNIVFLLKKSNVIFNNMEKISSSFKYTFTLPLFLIFTFGLFFLVNNLVKNRIDSNFINVENSQILDTTNELSKKDLNLDTSNYKVLKFKNYEDFER